MLLLLRRAIDALEMLLSLRRLERWCDACLQVQASLKLFHLLVPRSPRTSLLTGRQRDLFTYDNYLAAAASWAGQMLGGEGQRCRPCGEGGEAGRGRGVALRLL